MFSNLDRVIKTSFQESTSYEVSLITRYKMKRTVRSLRWKGLPVRTAYAL